MEKDMGRPAIEIHVDGGAVSNNFLMQFQADLTRAGVIRPEILETTALGAAFLAGLAVGFWRDTGEIASHIAVDRRFDPEKSPAEAEALLDRWHKAVERAREWAKEEL